MDTYGSFHRSGSPKWLVSFMENPIKKMIKNGGTPLFQESSEFYDLVPFEFLSIPPDGDHPDIRQIGLCLGEIGVEAFSRLG